MSTINHHLDPGTRMIARRLHGIGWSRFEVRWFLFGSFAHTEKTLAPVTAGNEGR